MHQKYSTTYLYSMKDFDLLSSALQSAVWAAFGHASIWSFFKDSSLSFYISACCIFAFAVIQHLCRVLKMSAQRNRRTIKVQYNRGSLYIHEQQLMIKLHTCLTYSVSSLLDDFDCDLICSVFSYHILFFNPSRQNFLFFSLITITHNHEHVGSQLLKDFSVSKVLNSLLSQSPTATDMSSLI